MTDNIVIQNEEIISVGELNKSAKYLLENTFNDVSVIGEISNLSRPSSGHIYFTLKDEDGAIRCAMFRNQNIKLNFSPENGDQCVLKGQVSIYAPRGDYQLIVKNIEPAGSGNLMQKFEALRKKLDDEGLDSDKILLTINNLSDSNIAINYFVEQNLTKNTVTSSSEKKYLINKSFFLYPKEIVFRSLSKILGKVSDNYYPPRGKSLIHLLNRLNSSNFKKTTLSSCIIDKINNMVVIYREN